jgi:MFS transporter, putative metabolite:H+ symporter
MAQPGRPADALIAFDSARLGLRYWLLIAVLMAHGVVEMFDFYLVGYLVSVVGPQWKLDFGQVSVILLAAGLGQVCSALPLARAADQWGRKPVLIASILIYAAAAGAISLVPDGAWMMFAALRFFVGVGFAGALVAQVTLIVEFSPTRFRTLISNASGAVAPLGVLFASLSAATLMGELGGWRGLAALGAIPLVFAAILFFLAPESPRWLISRGKTGKARDVIAAHLAGAEALAPPTAPAQPERPRFAELYAHPGRFWLVVVMVTAIGLASFTVSSWGPTIVSLLLQISPAEAAGLFVWISLAGMGGRALFTVAPHFIGRWRAMLICLSGSAIVLAVAAIFHGEFVGGWSVFFLCLIAGALLYDGGMTNVAPYCVELFPVRIAAQGGALGNTVTGVTKLAGPVMLALIAGSGNLLTPRATEEAILPAFLLIAAICAAGAMIMLFLRYETHGQPAEIAAAKSKEAAAVAS